MLSLAHFGLSLCIHVFVYIMRNTAASLDTNLSRFGQHCVWYMNGNVSFLWIQFFFFSPLQAVGFFFSCCRICKAPFWTSLDWISLWKSNSHLNNETELLFFFFFFALITWSLQSASAEQHILEVIPAPLKSTARWPEPLQILSRSPPRFCRRVVTDPRRHYRRPASSLE